MLQTNLVPSIKMKDFKTRHRTASVELDLTEVMRVGGNPQGLGPKPGKGGAKGLVDRSAGAPGGGVVSVERKESVPL